MVRLARYKSGLDDQWSCVHTVVTGFYFVGNGEALRNVVGICLECLVPIT